MNKKEKRLAMATALQSAASRFGCCHDMHAGCAAPETRDSRAGLCSIPFDFAADRARSFQLSRSMTVVEDITTQHVPEYKTKTVADALKKWGVNELDNALLITKARRPPLAPAAPRLPKNSPL